MNIEIGLPTGLKPFGIHSENKATAAGQAVGTQPFASFFNAYMNIAEETNTYQNQADQRQLDYAAGKTDDLSAVLLAQEKAYTSLNFTVQLTNKVIEAYKEVMRISI